MSLPSPHPSRILRIAAVAALALAVAGSTLAFQPRKLGRYDGAVKLREGGTVAIAPKPVEELPAGDALRAAWQKWESSQNGDWQVYLDERTGLPTLASGRGIAWVPGPGNTLEADGPVTLAELEAKARAFLEDHEVLLGEWNGQIELDDSASLQRREGVWQLVFRQVAGGVRVENARFDFHVGSGNLVAFGTHRWGPLQVDPVPQITAREARTLLEAYLGYDGAVEHEEAAPPELTLLALDPRMGTELERWRGARGEGITQRLVWRISFRVPGEIPLWVGEIDAHSGEIAAFYDAAHYNTLSGGVFPLRGDEDCAGGGCDFPFPMPFADYTEEGQSTAYTGDFGFFSCVSSADPVETRLDGQYVRIDETCGPVSATTTCGEPLALGLKVGENCEVEAGASPGNTAAARSAFYHVNKVKQAARAYHPDNEWLNDTVVTNTNVNNTCNASWSGEINMFRGGNGCGNTGENQGVLVHEWGHGFDQNDGGGYDNTSEAYADVVAIFWHRDGCIGPGFYADGRTCTGFGDTCLECTGVRDMDYTRRELNEPATPSGFVDPRCGSGSGPCGRQVHCESYPISEAIFELATVDLPATGMDEASAWQLAERLWYESRAGSGGDIYTCALPDSDSCSSSSWYQQMRVADDDDGNLDNGTPHAAALFAAFDRHDIACGSASDPENQNSGSCPTLETPTLSAGASGSGIDLSWNEVPDAASYTIFRGEMGCSAQQVMIGEAAAPATSFFDDDVSSESIVYYRVRPNGDNPACTGPVSNCVAIPEEAKLVEDGFRVDDSGANGDGDGLLEPGETFLLPVSLFNYGAEDATGVAGTLRPDRRAVTRVGDAGASWPDILQSDVQESLAPHFEVTVLPDAACGEKVSFQLESTGGNVPSRVDAIAVQMGTFLRDYVNDENKDIPHVTEEPVTSTIEITDERTITDLDVSIDISVIRSSDLIVEVTSPSGTTVRLKDQTSGGTSTRYDRDRQPDGPGTMDDFVGEPLQGTWTLAVQDVVSGPFPTSGTLDRWAIHAEVEEPFDCEAFECGDALPQEVPPTLLVTKTGADLFFDWDAATDADGYNLLSDEAVELTSPDLAGQTETATELTLGGGAGGDARITYYRVRGTNSCNWEGP
jgi:subtilisin-like proprotein convertase family protein